MQKKIPIWFLILAIFATAFASYRLTIANMSIETDGYGDSAFVTVWGQTHFMGINGYEIG